MVFNEDKFIGMHSNENDNENSNMNIKNNDRGSLDHTGIDQFRSKKKGKKRSRVEFHRLFQESRPRKGINSHDPFANGTTDEDVSIPSSINPRDPFAEDSSEEDSFPKRKMPNDKEIPMVFNED